MTSDRICRAGLHQIPSGDRKCKVCANRRRRERRAKSQNVNLSRDGVKCPVCGERFQTLGTDHIRLHGFPDLKTFKEQFGLASCLTLERRKKIGRYFANRPSPLKGKPSPQRGWKRSPESRARMSAAATRRCLQKKDAIFAGIQGKWVFSEKADQEVYVRSSYEYRLLQVLDHHPDVTDIELEPFRIPYTFDGVDGYYIPDFLVTFEGGIKELWEVKPERFLKDPRNQAKFAALNRYATSHGMNAGVITLERIAKMERQVVLLQCIWA